MDVNQIIADLINYNNPQNETITDKEYQKIFKEEGKKKAEYIVKHLSNDDELVNEDFSKYLYLSIGGSDGSEIEYIFRKTNISYAILVEISDEASSLARKRGDKLRSELGKELLVVQGDITQRMNDLIKMMKEFKSDRKLYGMILSTQAVIHELPKRSPGFRLSVFFGQLFSVYKNNIFYGREPMRPERWPETLELAIGNTSSENLKKIADIVNEKLSITKKEVIEVANNFINIDSVLCLEVLHKVIRSNNAENFIYELGEQLTSVNPNEMRRIVENHIGENTVLVEPMATNGFIKAWKSYKVKVKTETGDKLSFPNTHVRLKGVSIKDKRPRVNYNDLKYLKSKRSAIFVGPHPDDIELGAGATVAKLNHLKWNTFFVIVTKSKEKKVANSRKTEALEAARILKTFPENIIFLDYPDGELHLLEKNNLDQTLYDIIDKISPDLIFGPCNEDLHKDHIEVNKSLKFAAKSRGFLMYYVLHHIQEKKISKQVSINVSQFWNQKVKSCLAHKTEVQRHSITEKKLDYLKGFSSQNGMDYYEYFGIAEPTGYDIESFYAKVNEINNDTFGMLWSLALGIESKRNVSLNMIPVHVSNKGATLEGKGRSQLTSKLHSFFPKLSIEELIGGHEKVFDFRKKFYQQNSLFSGGALSNPWTFRFLFGYPSFIYRENQFMRHSTLAADRPVYEEEFDKGITNSKEKKTWGVVVIMWGWCIYNKKEPTTIYAAGVSREATYGAYLLLQNPLIEIYEALLKAKKENEAGIQVNFKLKSYQEPKSVSDLVLTNIDTLKKISFEETNIFNE
ncbi:PIG-L deacetylase family protein [Flagellimonas eckloniae]|uniref:LmbE family protein n=1 Tax=Flagellimonas eckloniae TaxID=346185 RepID=A0A0Q1BI44_9FLAO|nr:PIG-L family deacetylase [Allomuricauda eckloniae]KQC30230.1 hypothetical protein AAY42_10350 [Allomuricauda eckloniae]